MEQPVLLQAACSGTVPSGSAHSATAAAGSPSPLPSRSWGNGRRLGSGVSHGGDYTLGTRSCSVL